MVQQDQNTDVTILVGYVFAELTYGNWQRPAVGINLTREDVSKAIPDKSDPDTLTLLSGDHKTKGSEGPAFLTMSGTARDALLFYAHHVRPLLPNIPGHHNTCLVLRNGKPLINHRDILKTVTRRYHLPNLPTLTLTRKSGATELIRTHGDDNATVEALNRQMGHQRSTGDRYYRLSNRRQEATSIRQTMDLVTARGKHFNCH